MPCNPKKVDFLEYSLLYMPRQNAAIADQTVPVRYVEVPMEYRTLNMFRCGNRPSAHVLPPFAINNNCVRREKRKPNSMVQVDAKRPRTDDSCSSRSGR